MASFKGYTSVCLFLFVSLVFCAPLSDKINSNSLPGLTSNINFNQYAGYLTVNASRGSQLFYWFVESQSDPATDPLFVWLQGGPGCSSLFGFFTEHGPFVVTQSGSNGSQLALNPYTWNLNANIIYLEAPIGVGFSYSNYSGDYNSNDNITMINNYLALTSWFSLFPEYSKHEFYISGESYGGRYVPELAYYILTQNGLIESGFHSKNTAQYINLKGFFLGNPWTSDDIDSLAVPYFIYYHSLCSTYTWNLIVSECGINIEDFSSKHIVPSKIRRDFRRGKNSASPLGIEGSKASCDSALNQMYTEVGDLINQYDIYWPCETASGLDCMDYSLLTNYLNTDSVQKAIHARKPSQPWEVCADLNYDQNWSTVVPLYPIFIKAGLKVVVYSGDVTFNCATLGTEMWMDKLELGVSGNYSAWYVNGQVGGYVLKYNGLSLATVKGSGHMVSFFSPISGLELFNLYNKGALTN